jgi:hypothetical protein
MMRRAKTDSNAAVLPVISLGPTDFLKHIDCDITSSRTCLDSDEPCVSMCNCSVITSCVIEDMSRVGPACLNFRLSEEAVKNKKAFLLTTVDTYCVQRLMVAHGCYSADSYDIKTGRSYYGEEITGISLKTQDALTEDVEALLALKTDHAKVMFVLGLEYGFIADSIKDTTEVDVVSAALRWAMPVDVLMLKRQKGYLYPLNDNTVIGVMANDELIDGHKRLACRVSEKGASHDGFFIELR